MSALHKYSLIGVLFLFLQPIRCSPQAVASVASPNLGLLGPL